MQYGDQGDPRQLPGQYGKILPHQRAGGTAGGGSLHRHRCDPLVPRGSADIPDKGDTARWEALSPVGVADCFSNPLIVVHVTSDILVPIDQTTREFTCHFNM